MLATDPEAPIDLAALAADRGLRLTTRREVDHWRLAARALPRPRRTHAAGPEARRYLTDEYAKSQVVV